jgi:O-antigen/teichoic acid export membrane protein
MSGMATQLQASSAGAADRRNAVRGVAWGGVESGIRAGVGFLITPLIIHAFGIEGLGLWAACWSTAQMAALFDLGIGAVYSRFAAKAIAREDAEELNGTLAAGIGFHLLATAALAVAAIVAMPSMERAITHGTRFAADAPVVLGCAVAAVLLRLVLSVFRGVVAGAQRLDVLGRIGSSMAVLEGCGTAAIILSGGGLRGMAMNSLASAIVISLLEGRAAYRLCPQLRFRPFCARRSDWREVVSFGWKVQLVRIDEILVQHVPRLVLAAGAGLAVTGAYDLGARVAAALATVGTVPLPVIAPMASRLDARSLADRLQALLNRSTRYVALIVAPLAALILIDPSGLLLAWTGRDVADGAAATASILTLAAVLTLLASPMRLTLRGVGYAGIEAIAAMISTTLHLSLALALASRFGAIGVAGGALAASIVAALTLSVGARRIESGRFTRSIRQAIAAPILAGIAAFLAGWTFDLVTRSPAGAAADRFAALTHLMSEAAVVLIVFVLAAVLFRGIRREDLSLARVAVRAA